MAPKGLFDHDDGVRRCSWCRKTPEYIRYHDDEWGLPQADDNRLFEKLCLEGFQSGLSWLTILNKREGFRSAFKDFDLDRVARMNERSVERLLEDPGIVRHRKKIESTINNAKQAKKLRTEFGTLSAYFWQFEPAAADRPNRMNHAALMTLSKTPASVRLAKDLKARGFSFVGPTTAYAFMQAMGMVNDHLEGCAHRSVVDEARAKFRRPQ